MFSNYLFSSLALTCLFPIADGWGPLTQAPLLSTGSCLYSPGCTNTPILVSLSISCCRSATVKAIFYSIRLRACNDYKKIQTRSMCVKLQGCDETH